MDLPSNFNPEIETIYFEVFDYDRLVNDVIGKASVSLDSLEKGIAQQLTLNLHNAQKGTLTIELLAEDFGIIPEKTRSGQLSTTTQPPAYEDSPPPEYYDSQGHAYQPIQD
ncbi:predicted protein [Naegleria gruberi]|uniref:Predicted protein n=1 Tax=Naegleria gruberi TaxID=5762 RepID=D2VWY9_NAEGR|nr:uncharacterized protein NAEGRDRAFT_73553 [Naegleria gruberi]EFC38772.1 predicted protein [Naegleria gruberi]|eukprot:XP_002671516.1 predicted protein [Naegleria gruberi strain NEG-M]